MQTITFNRADEAFGAAAHAQSIGLVVGLGSDSGTTNWSVTVRPSSARFFSEQVLKAIREVRECQCVDLLRELDNYAQGMIHGARFSEVIDQEQHHNLFAMLKNAKQHAYDDLAAKAIAPGK